SLLPRAWRDRPNYQCINTTYKDCLVAEKWFASVTPLKGETTWELYKRYDPDGSRAMHQARFYSLMPSAWRKLPQYQYINATYEDCLAAEKWFDSVTPLEGETTWELYKRYDTDGSRAMNQAQFYSLLPSTWRDMQQYQRINATYEDCLAAERWFDSVTPLEGETTWELYKRYDPDGSRAMNQGNFYSLLPRVWRDMPQYQCINAPYTDCLAAEKWFDSITPLKGETTWELYKRYDPDGSRAMHQAQFYSLLPRVWRDMQQYQCINAPYTDCLAAEKWFASANPLEGETTWELYKRYDSDGSRAMNQAHFFSLLPHAWRKLPQYQYIGATYEDCLAAEKWFDSVTPLEGETTWELYKRYDPDGYRAMHQRQFYSLLPSTWRDMPQYQCISATYEDCLVAEKWFASATPLEGETTWELYKRYDPDGSRAMHQAHFFSLLPRAWRKLPQYQCINATYEDCLVAEKWFASVNPLKGETIWELYNRFDPTSALGMRQGEFFSLLPQGWRDLYQNNDPSWGTTS
ncbi:MAG: hypothetical protein GX589_01565, partial [Deltaproteobacteria bacterium]|nr:hypothetical protein [Deltaproteobacteria bacterium]